MKSNHPAMLNSPINKKGFTLIEASVAIVVLLIGLFAVMQFFPFSLEIIGDSNSRTIASNLALSQLEQVRANTYQNINVGTLESKQRISEDADSYLYDYQRETVIELVDSNFASSGSDVGLKKVTVTVYWLSPITKEEKSYSINSVIASF